MNSPRINDALANLDKVKKDADAIIASSMTSLNRTIARHAYHLAENKKKYDDAILLLRQAISEEL